MLAHDEISADTRVGISRLLGLTGRKPLNARRPHGEMRSGVSIASIWTTAVDIPEWQTGQGMRRRLSIIQTARQLDDQEKTFELDDDFLDAIITRGCKAAAAVYQPGYTPPYGEQKARKAVLADMDNLGDWLMELDPSWNGYETRKAREAYNATLDEGVAEVTATKFAAAVKRSGRWAVEDKCAGGRKHIRALKLLDNQMGLE